MTWIDELLHSCPKQLIINDSKTPSGIAHVGSLRGVLIHDAILRAAQADGRDATFRYGCDDMDSLDEIPHGTGDFYRNYIGTPLCHTPSPPGFPAKNMAQAYFTEFATTFDTLGVNAELYYVSDIYASGQFDETIDIFLRHADAVRNIYYRETGAVRPDDWLPYQPICQQCGRIATTFASDYNGDTVTYECKTDLVPWVQGCQSKGRVSPTGTNGKLPWKLEWAAKWKLFPVTVEGAGKDHMGAHGSHQVTRALSEEILHHSVPHSFAYEFLTLDGAKMSSSKGVGYHASDIVTLLPPEILRYLILKVRPQSAIDYSLDLQSTNRIFLDYERLWASVYEDSANYNHQQLFYLSQSRQSESISPPPEQSAPFDTIVSVTQQPHIDILAHLETISDTTLSVTDLQWLNAKQRTARHWIADYADEQHNFQITESLPLDTHNLPNPQRAFLAISGRILNHIDSWRAQDIQSALFDSARIVGIATSDAFSALYHAFFASLEGPRAGSFLEYYGKEATLSRMNPVRYSYRDLLISTAVSISEWENECLLAQDQSYELTFLPIWTSASITDQTRIKDISGPFADGLGSIELFAVDKKGRTASTRTIFESVEGYPLNHQQPIHAFYNDALAYLADLNTVSVNEIPLHSYNPFGETDEFGQLLI